MERLIAFNQEGALTDYCNTFQRLFDQVRNYEEISEFYGIYLFICGLEPEIREIFVDWHQYSCIKVEDVISLALKIDFNGLQDSFSPFDSNSSFYNKDLVFDVNITLEELMKNNEFFKNGMIQENIIEAVTDNTDSIDESENINSAYKVFDEMPEPIRDEIRIEIEAEFNDISICEIIFSEMPQQHSVIQEINEYKNDITSLVIHDVVLNASSDLNIWHYKNEIGVVSPVGSFGDIVYFVYFWGQKSLEKGVLGMGMVMHNFGWKPGWLHCLGDVVVTLEIVNEPEMVKSIEEVSDDVISVVTRTELLSKNDVVKRLFVFSNIEFDQASNDPWKTDYEVVHRKFNNEGYEEVLGIVLMLGTIRIDIGSFGWKPGWSSDTSLGIEVGFVEGVNGQGFSVGNGYCLVPGGIERVKRFKESKLLMEMFLGINFVAGACDVDALKEWNVESLAEEMENNCQNLSVLKQSVGNNVYTVVIQ